MNITLEITSAVAESDGGERILTEFAETCRRCGFLPAVQLHNTVSENCIKKIADCGLPMSAHAPVVGDFSLNLATEKNLDVIWKAFDDNAEFMRRHDIAKSVFHGFSMCDELIPRMRSQADYRVTLRKSCRDEFLLEDTWLNVDYTYMDEYKIRCEILKNNLAELRKRYPDLIFCIENDMPVYGYSNMKLSQMTCLNHPVCVDIGHLYSSSLLFDFDFFEDLEYGLQNLDVQMVHIHNSLMTADVPKRDLTDGHQKLTVRSELDWQKALKLFLKYGISDFVLEIGSTDAEDVLAFAQAVNDFYKNDQGVL